MGWLLLGSLSPVCQDDDTSGWMLTYLGLGILRDASSFLFQAYYCHSFTLQSRKARFAFVTIDEAVVFVLELDFVDWASTFNFALVVDDSSLDHMNVDKIQANFWWLR